MKGIVCARLGRVMTGLFVALVAASARPAAAITVTFDAGSGIQFSYTEAGMTVVPEVSGFYLNLGDNDGNTSPDLMNHPACCSTPYRFTYNGGAVFSVAKFDFVLNSGTHTFSSSTGGSVTPGASGLVTLPAAGWTGITFFRWHAPGSDPAQTAVMDNLKFCPGDCSDGNVCTDDSCDPDAAGADANGCIHTPNTAPCSDGLFCNGADTCSGGSCSSHAGDPCAGNAECGNVCNEALDTCIAPSGTPCTDDGNVCTDDQCNGSGACVHPNNSAPCSDGLFCNGTDVCSGGSCSFHSGNPCTGGPECANTCSEAGGGTCFATTGTACTDDGNGCTNDQCNGAGACVHPNNTAPCNDGVFCNGADTCQGGSCGHHAGNPCAGGAECANTCNEGAQNCFTPTGTSCTDDGNECTDDKCNGSGACTHPNNSAPCDDGVFCNGADTCSTGSCKVHAGNPCTGGPECANTCNEEATNCFRPAGTACSTDNNVCTDDKCDGAGACGHVANTASCNDNDACTVGDHCAGGSCVSSPRNCDDNNQCTADSCDSGSGCVNDPVPLNGSSCNDGNTCTDGDTCSNGVCGGNQLPQSCDDGNPCTLDGCDPQGGCTHDTAARDGFVCDDQNPCTQQDTCANGVCHGALFQADTDGDGYCDIVENQAGCNPNDGAEIPIRPSTFAGAPGKGSGEVILTYLAPATSKPVVATDPSCATGGTCGPIGFCTAGTIGDPCLTNADCNQPPNTCRMVLNVGDVPNLTLLYARLNNVKANYPGFAPISPGCSRKVDLTIDPSRRFNKLKLKASGTVSGKTRRDSDGFKYYLTAP